MCSLRELGSAYFLRHLQDHLVVAQQQYHQGWLPLHFVMETGKSFNHVKALVLENPNELNESHPLSGLPCFLLAMVVKDD